MVSELWINDVRVGGDRDFGIDSRKGFMFSILDTCMILSGVKF